MSVKVAVVYRCDGCGEQFSGDGLGLGYTAKKYFVRDVTYNRQEVYKFPHRQWTYIPANKSKSGNPVDLCKWCAKDKLKEFLKDV
jgi:hypothetical protein